VPDLKTVFGQNTTFWFYFKSFNLQPFIFKVKRLLLLLSVILSALCGCYAQIIQAPRLECVQDSTSNNDIILYWANPPVNPCGTFAQYTIYASSNGPGGPYNQIAVTNQAATSYILANYPTSQTWYFYMEAEYTNCPGATVLQSDTVNNKNPNTPQIVSVTVTPGGQVIFTWLPSTSPQTTRYVVYNAYPNAGPQQLATVSGRLTTTYTDTIDNPDIGSLGYTVAAVDSCGEISSYNTSPQYTIFMQAAVTECQRKIAVNWTKYINWPQGVQQYQVWVSRNDSAYQVAGTTDSSTLGYTYTQFNDGDSLCFIVRAVSAADTTIVSNSNQVCMKAFIVQPPAFIYITNITVDAFNHVLITWNVDTMGQLLDYDMFQSTDGVTYNPLSIFSVPTPLIPFQTYDDSSGSPQNNPYYYKIVTSDSCQNLYTSPPGESISLQGQLYDYFVISLNWNEFQLFGATVLYYNIYRDYGGGAGYQLIKTVPDQTVTDLDSVQQFLDIPGVFCYKVEAIYYLSLPNGYHDTLTSWSNVTCVIHRPVIYIPTAFSPNGPVSANNTFKPTIIYGAPQGYTMIIYNRWGGEVFISHDPTVGWDGSDHGKEGTEGGYAYHIEFKSDDGVEVKRDGIVLLVR